MVRQFVLDRFGISLSRSSCLNWLHCLGFAFIRPRKRLLKADEERRAAFVAEHAAMWEESQGTGTWIFFADEAHFRADAELRGRWNGWVLGQAQQDGNSNSGTSVAFLKQLKEKHPGPVKVIWDNAPAPFDRLRSGEAPREYLRLS